MTIFKWVQKRRLGFNQIDDSWLKTNSPKESWIKIWRQFRRYAFSSLKTTTEHTSKQRTIYAFSKAVNNHVLIWYAWFCVSLPLNVSQFEKCLVMMMGLLCAYSKRNISNRVLYISGFGTHLYTDDTLLTPLICSTEPPVRNRIPRESINTYTTGYVCRAGGEAKSAEKVMNGFRQHVWRDSARPRGCCHRIFMVPARNSHTLNGLIRINWAKTDGILRPPVQWTGMCAVETVRLWMERLNMRIIILNEMFQRHLRKYSW